MNESLNEQVSACVDGEVSAAETGMLLRRLSSDDGLRARWERYHLIGDALKKNLPARISTDFADRVMRGLDQQPVPQRRFTVSHLLKPAAGFAIAATVAALAVISVQTLHSGRTPQPAPVAALTAPLPAAAPYARVTGTRWDSARPEVAARLNNYLLSHRGHADPAGVQAMLPYARIVGYDTDE